MRLLADRTHPDEGVLRRLLDEPAAVADADRAHVAACAACRQTLARVHDEARAAAALFTVPAGPLPDADAAWARLAAAAPAGTATARPAREGRWRRAVRSPLVAVGGAVLLVTGTGVAAANDWLPIFSTQQVVPVQVASADLVQVPDLSAYGDLTVDGADGVQPTTDVDAAEARSGMTLPELEQLPDGVSGDATYESVGPVTATFTFSAAKAAAAAAAQGEQLPPVPAGLDGAQVRIHAGPGLAAVWGGGGPVPRLIVARLVAPTAESNGVPFETVRNYLLSLPGLPDDLATQLRDISSDAATLPLPVPTDVANSSSADVDGHKATVLTARQGTFAGVVWVDHGVVTAVAGSFTPDEALAVARGLR